MHSDILDELYRQYYAAAAAPGTGEELLRLYDSGVVGDILGLEAYIAL